MKLKNLFLSSLLLTIPFIGFFATSCKINNFLEINDKYNESFNFPNESNNFSIYNKNNISKKINNLISTKLFRIVSQDQPEIDFVNNRILKPSKMFLKFEQATKIQITWNNNNKEEISIFNTDTINNVSFDDLSLNNQVIGYRNLYEFIKSNDEHSINSWNFKKALENAKKIEIFVENNKNPWLDSELNKTKHHLNIQDFKLGFLKSIMSSLTNRQKILKTNKLLDYDEKITQNISYFNQDNILNYLQSNNIETKQFLDPNFIKDDLPLTFKLIENKNIKSSNWWTVFQNIFLLDNVTDALPSFKFNLDFSLNETKNYDFLYEYGKTYKDLFYSSYYFISQNTLNNIKLKKNKYYINNTNWQNESHFNEINFKFNVLPINLQTYNIQTFNAFNQNLNSVLDFDNLDELQKQSIIDNLENYNLNYFKNYQTYNNQTPLIINLFPHSQNLFFNNTFSRLYFGLTKNELNKNYELKNTVTKQTIIFRNLINNVINPYILSNLKNADIYLSQAPSGLFISSSNNSNTNYTNLIDATQQISKQIIFDNNLQKINKTTSFDNKQKAKRLDNIINYNESLKSVDFYQIQNIIKPILDDYFKQHTDEKSVTWTIPIDNRQGHYAISKLASFIKSTFKNLDNRLNVEVQFIENIDDYNLFFKNQNSLYNENNFELVTTDTNGFLYKYLTQNDYKNLLELIFVWDVIQNTQSYPEINQFIKKLENYLKDNNALYSHKIFNNFKYLDFEHINTFFSRNLNWNLDTFNNLLLSFIIHYSQTHTTFQILNLINEIANVFSYTISVDNYISLNSFSKKILQKYIIKPASYYNLEYLQDTLILEKR
ncbi:OppA family ABC transporter substrate-binding lipoprotein [Mycoplasma miroungirhinis]|uniref:Lipoprotein n=1 Tax=Mycoplasma miroungirhinis TaxID=754516 RepID=A0A6M4JBM1_9MOLU|nr:hypothetical protein [Mycoplasma miroungirhinis]QJR44403.1 hypothetical protein HLA92_03115 [Mycoplasma miroungirhinis]